jgi:nucleoside phosphorylase/tetratricopeptide (TPR) repeat protein
VKALGRDGPSANCSVICYDRTPNMIRSLLLCALPVEEVAWVNAFHERGVALKVAFDRGQAIQRGSFEADGTTHELILAVTGDGNARAGIVSARLIERYQPKIVIFAGIAGGLKDVIRGDVVVVSECTYYSVGKAGETQTYDGSPVVTPKQLLSFGETVTHNEPGTYKTIVGKLAVTDVVLQNVNSDIGRVIATASRKALAVAMEDYGVLRAAYDAEVPAISVRGISDLCADKEPSDDHETPAAHAAEVAIQIWFEWILKSPIPPKTEATGFPERERVPGTPSDFELNGLTVPLLVLEQLLGDGFVPITERWLEEGTAGSIVSSLRFSGDRSDSLSPSIQLWLATEEGLLQTEDPISVARIADFADELRTLTGISCERSSALRVAGNQLDQFSSCKHGRVFLKHALEDAQRDGDKSQLFACLVAMAWREHHDDREDAAQELAQRAMILDPQLVLTPAVGSARFDLYVLMASLEFASADVDSVSEYLEKCEQLVRVLQLEQAHERWSIHIQIAQDRGDQQRLEEIESELEGEIAKLNPETRLVSKARLMLFRAMCLSALKRYAEAERLLDENVGIQEFAGSEIAPGILETRAHLYLQSGEPSRAVELYERLLRKQEAHFGPDHSALVGTLDNLGVALTDCGRALEALVHFDRAVTLSSRAKPVDQALLLQNRSWARNRCGDLDGARVDSRSAYETIRDSSAAPSFVTAQIAHQYANYAWWVDRASAEEPLALAREHLGVVPSSRERDETERAIEDLEEALLGVTLETALAAAGVQLFTYDSKMFVALSDARIEMEREREFVVTPELARQKPINDRVPAKIAMLVADEIRKAARNELERRGWSWFDRSTGEGNLIADGTLIPLSTTPRPQRGPRVSSTSVNGKLRIGVWLLENPKHTASVREIGRKVELSVSQVSGILQQWRSEGLLEPTNQPLLPEFFQEMSKLWTSDWHSCEGVPSGIETVLTSAQAAEFLGAPTLGGTNSTKYVYVASPADLRKALNGVPRQNQEGERVFVALAPTPLVFGGTQLLSEEKPTSERLAPKSVIALDLSRGSSRDRDVLANWGQEDEYRVW